MKTLNTYAKYCPNVFVAKCAEQHEKGSIIEMTTKSGNVHNVIVCNLVITGKDGYYYYSIVREDGYNRQERAKNKIEKLKSWAESATKKSEQYYEASQEGKDFLSLAEPIKVGHHSEKKHRALIERNWNRMGKSVEFAEKSKEHLSKVSFFEAEKEKIDLSMPESLEYFAHLLSAAKEEHAKLKSGALKKQHSFSLTYAKKKVNDMQKSYDLAVKLWN